MSPSRLPLTSPVPIPAFRSQYCFAVPANRIGSAVYSPAELKTIQEVITLIVFAGFTAVYFNEPLSWTQAAGFALIALGAALVFHGQA